MLPGSAQGLAVTWLFWLFGCCDVLLNSDCGYYSDITEPSQHRARKMSISLFLLRKIVEIHINYNY